MPEELWMEVHDIVQEAGIKTIPKKGKKAKRLFVGALQIAVKKKDKQKAKEKRKDIPI